MKDRESHLTNILAIALDNEVFRKNLIKSPEVTLEKSGIAASKEDIEALRNILERADYDVQRMGCTYNMECGYRGY